MRLTYSLDRGYCTNFTPCSTCIAYCLPILISLSCEYQLPIPRPPTLRLPIASTSALLPSCLTRLSSGSWMGGRPLGADSVPLEVESGVGAGSCGGVGVEPVAGAVL